MKNIKLIEALNNIEDQNINTVLEIKNKEDLQRLKKLEKKEKNKYGFRILTACVSCVLVFMVGLFLLNNQNDNNVEVTSPITELYSITELETYLTYDVPDVDVLEVSNILVIRDGDDYLGRIIYEDDSVLSMSKSVDDPSGVYGLEFIKNIEVNDIAVKLYQYEETKVYIWKYKKVNYSYSTSNDDVEAILNSFIQ